MIKNLAILFYCCPHDWLYNGENIRYFIVIEYRIPRSELSSRMRLNFPTAVPPVDTELVEDKKRLGDLLPAFRVGVCKLIGHHHFLLYIINNVF